MNHKYAQYTSDKLLTDDYFLQSELYPTEESKLFWSEIEKQDSQLSKQINQARLVLQTIRDESYEPVLEEKEETILWERINYINKRRSGKKILLLSAIASAVAVIAALLILNKTHEVNLQETPDYISLIESAEQVQDDSGNIQLVLSDKKKLYLHGKESEIEYEEEGEIRINSEKVQISEEEKLEQAHNTLIVPVGKRSHLILADGTQIWVNSDSKVVYPVQFGSTKREIYVEGEIYLDVNHNPDLPFVLKTKDSEITVLGTQFNVTAYKNETQTDIVLVEGKIEVNLPDQEKSILLPNQLISYNTETQESTLRNVEDMADFTAWKDGYYQFRQQTMDTVLKKVAKYYGLQLEWNEQMKTLTCSGKLDLKNDPAEVLRVLTKAAPIEVEQIGDKYAIIIKH